MKIFCDFDGTAAKTDVGNLLFRTFADQRCFTIVEQWKEGKISSKECLIQECKITKVTKTELERFADVQELDPYFVSLVDYCQQKSIEIEILSDGLDFYIDRILKKYKLVDRVNFRSNQLKFLNHDRITADFPYFELGCGKCANCKGFHVRKAKDSAKPIVYIGDGLSDRCGAVEADIVFAKQGRDLLEFCRESKLDYYEFTDFKDVLTIIKELA